MMHRISLIVATKDRPDDLRTLLESLRRQTIAPVEIVVVDASREPVEPVIAEFSELTTRYLRHWPPSAAAQRNAGIRACAPTATLIGFADDDTTFEPQAFANMLSFWNKAAPDVLGAAFNIRNYPCRGNEFLKHSALAKWLGLYSARPGSVSPSGWQTVIGEIDETQYVDWLPSTAVIFRREAFRQNLFDDAFDSYSYLEDLDLSYTISRIGRLAVVAEAGFSHFPSTGGRVSARQFGHYEVRNRLYFVRKHHISLPRCYLGLAIRLAMSIGSGLVRLDPSLLNRALGNMEELIKQSAAPAKKVAAEAPQR
jgi:GT2 family glycosyltransferase